MNSLVEKYGDKIAILAFPSNQFGHQKNESDGEFLNMLQYVRPGNGFKPKCEVFKSIDVNGSKEHPLFKWMKREIKAPSDENMDSKGNGVDDSDVLILSRGKFGNSTVTLWTPVCRSDIAWNFEKFLLDKSGMLVKRYSRYYDTNSIASDIDTLL